MEEMPSLGAEMIRHWAKSWRSGDQRQDAEVYVDLWRGDPGQEEGGCR